MSKTWRIGTRGSDLARVQCQGVADALAKVVRAPVELVVIQTRGDAIRDRPLSQVGGKGVFTKEIERALLDGEVDLAVHSMKDMPTENPEGLVIASIPERVDPRDALVGAKLSLLPEGSVVGTGSARRQAQIKALRPDLVVKGIRGNVETRIRKQVSGEYDAVVLAAAGLERLGRSREVAEFMSVEQMVPAVGQGALAIQIRSDDTETRAAVEKLDHGETRTCIEAERAFLHAISGGCSVPAACHARLEKHGRLELRAFYAREDGVWVSETGRCVPSDGPRAAAELAHHLIERLAAQPPRIEGLPDADDGAADAPTEEA